MISYSAVRHFSFIFLLVGLLFLPSRAKAQDFQVDVRRLDQVENPSELQRWGHIADTPEGKALIAIGLSYFGVPPAYAATAATAITAAMGNFPASGTSHVGYIQAPVGYTVCHAEVHQWDPNKPDHIGGYGPSLNCGNTFNATYRTADDPHSANIDGLHWYMVVNRPGIGAGSCWVDGMVSVFFVKYEKKGNYNCAHSGDVAWTYKN